MKFFFLFRKLLAEQNLKNRKKKIKDKKKIAPDLIEAIPEESTESVLRMEIEPNASKFAVFSVIRSSVLEAETKCNLSTCTHSSGIEKSDANLPCCFHCAATCKSGAAIDCRCHHHNNSIATKSFDNDSDTEIFSEESTEHDVIVQVPQVNSYVL